MDEARDLLEHAARLLAYRTPVLPREEVEALVGSFLARRDEILCLAREHGSPLYVVDRAALRTRVKRFTRAFDEALPGARHYYALKSNSCPELVRIIVEQGMGLDASSGVELELALDCGAQDIVFSGPAKRDDELVLAVAHAGRVTVLIDSFRELERVAAIAAGQGATVPAGVRLMVDNRGLWRKFGIALGDLPAFLARADGTAAIDLSGLQFHSSWNMGPGPQVELLTRVGQALAGVSTAWCERIRFVDIGGGFWPPQGEWLHAVATPEGRLRAAIMGAEPGMSEHYRIPAAPIEVFAQELAAAVREHILPRASCRVHTEPGRWICNDGMHILLTVVDRKGEDVVITDAGTNAVGWERYETDYFPVINLSRPGLAEHRCDVLGSLCTPHDVWGFSYHGEGIEPGDVLLVPTQGAYTYSLRQHFIKPLPQTVVLG